MVQYYTLEQAAKILRVTVDRLKEMAKRNEVRAFQDRGTLRFRAQEIDELARATHGSDPELQPGDAPTAAAPPVRTSGKQTAYAPPDAPIFASDPEDGSDEVNLGKDPAASKTAGKSPRPRTGSPKSPAPKSPPPKAASDSDVRLVADGSDLDFRISLDDSDSKAPASKPGSSSRKQDDSDFPLLADDGQSDSDVKLVPDDSDEETVSLGQQGPKLPSDSDIRLEGEPSRVGKGSDDSLVTEEIDLDAEERRLKEEQARAKAKAKGKKGKGSPGDSSPFELSDSDLKLQPAQAEDGSSDFDLRPGKPPSSELEISSDEMVPLKTDSSDEVDLGEKSGINLQDPVDSGISLEQGGSDEIEFELVGEEQTQPATPRPAAKKKSADAESDSEFELTLDDSSGHRAALVAGAEPDSSSEFELALDDSDSSSDVVTDEGSDSEFELTLDVDPSGSDLPLEAVDLTDASSDSEFELTLDETGGLSALDDSDGGSSDDEKDIFETDFDVPAAEDESGSEAVALEGSDDDLESSDFDVSLDDDEVSEDSDSQVVALDDQDDEADESAETVLKKRKGKGKARKQGSADLESAFADAATDDFGDDLDEDRAPAPAPAGFAPPVPWGPLPALVLLPTILVLFVVGLMAFELIQGMWGYQRGAKVPSLIVRPLAEMLAGDNKLPPE